MKIKFSLPLTALLFCSFLLEETAFAQEVIAESEIELLNSARDKVSIDKVSLNKNGTVSIYAFTQLAEESTAAEAASCTPVLVVYELSDSLKLLKKVEEKVQSPFLQAKKEKAMLTTVAGKGANSQAKGGDVGDFKTAYPDFFQYHQKDDEIFSAAEYLIGSPLVSHTRVHYEYDWLSNSFPVVKLEERKFKLDIPIPSHGSLFIHDRILSNDQLRLISLVAGSRQEGESSQSLHFLQQSLYLYNMVGRQLSEHQLSFDFPMELRLHQFVKDEKGNSKGMVYLYGNARRFGHHKISEADPAAYRVVLLDKQGQELIDHSFKYGSPGSASEPFFAGIHKEKLFILGKGVGKEQDYHLMVFNGKELQTLTIIDPDLLFSNTVGEYKYSISNEYGSRFLPHGFQVLENGEMIFYGEHSLTVQNARFDTGTNSQLPPEYQYVSFSFLHFSKEGDFLRNYVVPRRTLSNLRKAAKITFLSDKDSQLRFLVSEPRDGEQEYSDYLMFSTTMGEKKVCKGCGEGPESPAIISIELNNAEVDCLRFPDDAVNIKGSYPFILDSTRNELLLLTSSPNSLLPLKLYLKRIRL